NSSQSGNSGESHYGPILIFSCPKPLVSTRSVFPLRLFLWSPFASPVPMVAFRSAKVVRKGIMQAQHLVVKGIMQTQHLVVGIVDCQSWQFRELLLAGGQ
ncbi:MAG: hypothetical protein KDB22_22675, partial [Planctomycetales bacterium]|nr:hypothetical protein [Planctomycetales bacterium]